MIGADTSAELAGRSIAKEHVVSHAIPPPVLSPLSRRVTSEFGVKNHRERKRRERESEREEENGTGGKSWPISKQTLIRPTFPSILANTRLGNFNETREERPLPYRYYSNDAAPTFRRFLVRVTRSWKLPETRGDRRKSGRTTTMAFLSVRFDVD